MANDPSKSRRIAFFYILMSLLATTACFVLLLGYYTYQAYKDPFKKVNIRIEGDDILTDDEEIGFVPTKNSSSRRIHTLSKLDYQLFTDHLGARVNRKGDRTPDRVDLLAVGGSYTWGHGVESEETFIQRLGQMTGLTVANFAMASYGTTQSFLMLKEYKTLRPRFVIYGLIGAHLNRNVRACAPSYAPYCLSVPHVAFDTDLNPVLRPPTKGHISQRMRQKFVREVVYSTGIGIHDVLWKVRADFYRLRRPEEVESAPGQKAAAFEFLVEKMVAEAQSIQARLIVVFIPILYPDQVSGPPGGVLKALAGKELDFVDVTPFVRAHYERHEDSLLRFKSDRHPNSRGHELIAESLRQSMASMGYLDALPRDL